VFFRELDCELIDRVNRVGVADSININPAHSEPIVLFRSQRAHFQSLFTTGFHRLSVVGTPGRDKVDEIKGSDLACNFCRLCSVPGGSGQMIRQNPIR